MDHERQTNKPIDIADVPPTAVFQMVLPPGEGDLRKKSYYRLHPRSPDLGLYIEVSPAKKGWEDVMVTENPPTISATFFSKGQQVLVVGSLQNKKGQA